MSQNASILAALKRGPLTPLYALQQLGVMRLAARVYELRQCGHNITARKRELPRIADSFPPPPKPWTSSPVSVRVCSMPAKADASSESARHGTSRCLQSATRLLRYRKSD